MNVSYDLDKYMGSFNFRISIDGVPQECSKVVSVQSVQSESELVEYQLGHEPFMRKTPGRSKFSEIEITRVYQGYDQFYNWRMMIEEGIDNLRTVNIEILAPDLTTVVRKMVLHDCWPSRWQLPNLDANSNEAAMETITLTCGRMTQDVSTALAGAVGSAAANLPVGSMPLGESQVFGESAIAEDDSGERLKALMDARADALALSMQLGGGPLDPNEASWEPPEPLEDDPTAAKQGGDGSGPVIKGNASGEKQEFDDTVLGDGPIGGRGAQEEVEAEDGEGPIENELNKGWGGSEGAEDPTAAQNGGDGSGPVIKGNATGEKQEFSDSTADEGKPLDPNEETWDAPESNFEDITAAKQGGDGSGPVIKGNASGAKQEFGDTGGGAGPLDPNEESWDAPEAGDDSKDFRDNDLTKFQGEGEQDFRDNATGINTADDPTAGNNGGDGTGPLDPNEESWDAPDGFEDPTAGRNGGDGTGPIGGRGAQAAFDGGAGDGPIENEAQDWGGSAAADDPTAAQNGGDGSGPIGGRGAQAAADGGAGDGPIENEAQDWGGSAAADDPTAARNGGDGSGPVGGRGAAAEADYGSPGSGPIGGRGAQETPGE